MADEIQEVVGEQETVEQQEPSDDYKSKYEELQKQYEVEAGNFKSNIQGLDRKVTEQQKIIDELNKERMTKEQLKEFEEKKVRDEMESIRKELKDYRVNEIKHKIIREKGMKPSDIDWLFGDSEEEIRLYAEKLLERDGNVASSLKKEIYNGETPKRGNSPTGEKTMLRSEWEKLPPHERRSVTAEGVKVID
jgi:uncharacterized coiled-coil protein SlyX